MLLQLHRYAVLTLTLLATPVAAGEAAFEEASSTTLLNWRAPDGCPNESDFRSRVKEYLGGNPLSGHAPTHADAVVVPASGGYHVTLRLEQAGQPRVRILDTARCVEALDAAALIVALAMDPSAGARLAESDSTPMPTAAVARPTGSPSFSGENIAAPQTAAMTAAIPPPQTVLPAPAPTQCLAEQAPLRTADAPPDFVFLQLTSANARRLPGLSLGLGLGAAIRWARLRISLAAMTSDGVARSTSGGGEFRLFEGRAQGCYLTGLHWRIGPCAAMSVGLLTAKGFDVAIPERKTKTWWTGGLGVLLQYMPGDFSEIGIYANAEHPFTRSYFELSGSTIYRPPAVGFEAGWMLGLRFK